MNRNAGVAAVEDLECPVCYVAPTSCSPLPAVTCRVCMHAVCGECDTTMMHAGHERCSMCRAPRPSRSTLSQLHPVLLHAFRCTDADCQSPQCTDTKLVLLRMDMHTEHCTNLELSGPDECKVCKLWRMLDNSRPPCAQEVAGATNYRRPAPEAVRARLRQLPPAHVKRMLLSHVGQCRNRRCGICRKLRSVRSRNQAVTS